MAHKWREQALINAERSTQRAGIERSGAAGRRDAPEAKRGLRRKRGHYAMVPVAFTLVPERDVRVSELALKAHDRSLISSWLAAFPLRKQHRYGVLQGGRRCEIDVNAVGRAALKRPSSQFMRSHWERYHEPPPSTDHHRRVTCGSRSIRLRWRRLFGWRIWSSTRGTTPGVRLALQCAERASYGHRHGAHQPGHRRPG
jgi:hypothetical protein